MTPSPKGGGKFSFVTDGVSGVALSCKRRVVFPAVSFDNSFGSVANQDQSPTVYSLFLASTPNNPLFDCYFIDFEERRAVIWIFQISMSLDHKGSARGYEHVAAIREWAKKVLRQESIAAVQRVPADEADALAFEEYMQGDDDDDNGNGNGEQQPDNRGVGDTKQQLGEEDQGDTEQRSGEEDLDEPAAKRPRVAIDDNEIELNYVLVCPSTPAGQRRWVMPMGGCGTSWWTLTDTSKGRLFISFVSCKFLVRLHMYIRRGVNWHCTLS